MKENDLDVLKEFGAVRDTDGTVLAYATNGNPHLMAREIVKLRAQLAGVREKVEKLERFDATLEHGEARMQRSDDACWIDRDDVLAALDGAK